MAPWTSDRVTNTYNGGRIRSGLVLQQPSGPRTSLTVNLGTSGDARLARAKFGRDQKT